MKPSSLLQWLFFGFTCVSSVRVARGGADQHHFQGRTAGSTSFHSLTATPTRTTSLVNSTSGSIVVTSVSNSGNRLDDSFSSSVAVEKRQPNSLQRQEATNKSHSRDYYSLKGTGVKRNLYSNGGGQKKIPNNDIREGSIVVGGGMNRNNNNQNKGVADSNGVKNRNSSSTDDVENVDRINPDKGVNTTELDRPNQPNNGRTADNLVEFSLFVALQPQARSVGHILQVVQAVVLNMVSSEKYRFRLEDQNVQVIDYVLSLQTKRPDIDLILQTRVLTQVLHRGQKRWWWRYLFRYNTFWTYTGVPVNATIRDEVQTNVNDYIQEAMGLQDVVYSLMADLNFHVDDRFRIELDLPTDLNTTDPADASGLAPPSSSPDPENAGTNTTNDPKDSEESPSPCDLMDYWVEGGKRPVANGGGIKDTTTGRDPCINLTDKTLYPTPFPDMPFDPSTRQWSEGEWDWRRYAGLGMLFITVSGTVCLAQLAALRRTRRNRSELWSNLSTEEGVNELLRMGWKINGSNMEIYDKMNSGYRDDDSLFIGGFEQRDVSGREITVTQSESTPDGIQR